MADEKKKKKSDTMVDSEGTVEVVVSEQSSIKKEKKKKKKYGEKKDGFAGEDGEIGGSKRVELVVKKKSKKQKVDSEAEDDSVKKNEETKVDSEANDDGEKEEEKRADSEPEDGVKKKKKKKNKESKVDSEADDDKKTKQSKNESGDDEIGNSESSKLYEKPLVLTDDANGNNGKRKRDGCGLGAQEDTEKEIKRKSKKKKPSVDSEVEETGLSSSTNGAKKKSKEKKTSEVSSEVEEANKDSTKDAKKEKKKKQSVDSEVEDNNLNSTKDAKKKSKEKKQSVDSEAEGNDLNSTKDAKKKRKGKKQSEDSEAEENGLNSTKDAKKKRKKKKNKQSEALEAEENNNDGKEAKKKRKKQVSDKDVTTPSSKSTKKVKFSDKLEIFHSEDEETDEEEVKVVRGKRFTDEENELVKKAVIEYVENHALGDEGIKMVMECKLHPQLKGCWKEIATALPWRTHESVYHRAHTLFEAGSKGVWTKEDLDLVLEYQKKHGNDWRTLADAMGKHRKHVKDAYRRMRLASKKKGNWTREEYQTLFDLVNKDLKIKAIQDKFSKHGMLRDNIPWMAISDELGTRDHVNCCGKWYDQLQSPLVAKGVWANVDDYRLLEELLKLDAACIDDVDWDELLEHRDGEICRKRWNQMVLHIGVPKSKTFAEQVEILAERYRPELAEDREDFDNRPFDPED